MSLLNLSLFQFLTLFGSISAIAVALYLLDRSRRKQVVSTLRFWVSAEQPAIAARRRRINQPWSLILQLVSMALLLLAIAQLRFGSPAGAGRDHVIVLDTGSWMAARARSGVLMDAAKQRAVQYLHALPARDRVMLVRAGAIASPATAFEPDRKKVEDAIRASQPGATALHLDQALAFARRIQSQGGGQVGEIAYVGAARTVERDPGLAAPPRNLRVLLIADAGVDNAGLRKIGTRRSTTEPDTWEIFVEAHNYGSRPRNVTLSVDFGPPGTAGRVPGGTQTFALAPGTGKEAGFTYRTAAAGVLGIHLAPGDAFPGDDHAELELPAQPSVPVTVYSNEPDLIRPILAATPRIAAIYRKPEEYRPTDRGIVILDRFAPAQRPVTDSIWIDPPPGAPFAVRKTVEQAPLQSWAAAHPATMGLRARDFKLDRAQVFEPAAGDDRIAEVDAGPVILARPGKPKTIVFGFHPALSAMRYELATPLLFANLLRWVSPEIFRRSEIAGTGVGTVKLILEQETAEQDIKVTAQDGSALPFTVRDRALNFFSGAPGAVKVVAGDREYLYSLTLPQLGESKWEPPAEALKGIPRFAQISGSVTDIWPWLAVLGAAGLLVEWILYGRFRRVVMARPVVLRRRSAAAVEARR